MGSLRDSLQAGGCGEKNHPPERLPVPVHNATLVRLNLSRSVSTLFAQKMRNFLSWMETRSVIEQKVFIHASFARHTLHSVGNSSLVYLFEGFFVYPVEDAALVVVRQAIAHLLRYSGDLYPWAGSTDANLRFLEIGTHDRISFLGYETCSRRC